MNNVTRSSQFIAISLKVCDFIDFRWFFYFFSICCASRQLVFYSHHWEVPTNSLYFKKNMLSDFFCRNWCFVCWTICIFKNSFVSCVFVVLFLFLLRIRIITDPNDSQTWPNWTYLFFQYCFVWIYKYTNCIKST